VTTSGAVESARRAFERAKVDLSEIDVFEIYDAFSSQLLIMLEDIGLCPKGEGGRFVESTDFGPGGDVPLNTSGGGLSYGANAASGRLRARARRWFRAMAASFSAK
jgi:acetyl-CoA acetyltransferase